MPRRCRLVWNRTDPDSPDAHDFTGLDLDRPGFAARVFLSSLSSADERWSWYLGERITIAAGEASTVEEAVDAAERVYAVWRNFQSRRQPGLAGRREKLGPFCDRDPFVC